MNQILFSRLLGSAMAETKKNLASINIFFLKDKMIDALEKRQRELERNQMFSRSEINENFRYDSWGDPGDIYHEVPGVKKRCTFQDCFATDFDSLMFTCKHCGKPYCYRHLRYLELDVSGMIEGTCLHCAGPIKPITVMNEYDVFEVGFMAYEKNRTLNEISAIISSLKHDEFGLNISEKTSLSTFTGALIKSEFNITFLNSFIHKKLARKILPIISYNDYINQFPSYKHLLIEGEPPISRETRSTRGISIFDLLDAMINTACATATDKDMMRAMIDYEIEKIPLFATMKDRFYENSREFFNFKKPTRFFFGENHLFTLRDDTRMPPMKAQITPHASIDRGRIPAFEIKGSSTDDEKYFHMMACKGLQRYIYLLKLLGNKTLGINKADIALQDLLPRLIAEPGALPALVPDEQGSLVPDPALIEKLSNILREYAYTKGARFEYIIRRTEGKENAYTVNWEYIGTSWTTPRIYDPQGMSLATAPAKLELAGIFTFLYSFHGECNYSDESFTISEPPTGSTDIEAFSKYKRHLRWMPDLSNALHEFLTHFAGKKVRDFDRETWRQFRKNLKEILQTTAALPMHALSKFDTKIQDTIPLCDEVPTTEEARMPAKIVEKIYKEMAPLVKEKVSKARLLGTDGIDNDILYVENGIMVYYLFPNIRDQCMDLFVNEAHRILMKTITRATPEDEDRVKGIMNAVITTVNFYANISNYYNIVTQKFAGETDKIDFIKDACEGRLSEDAVEREEPSYVLITRGKDPIRFWQFLFLLENLKIDHTPVDNARNLTTMETKDEAHHNLRIVAYNYYLGAISAMYKLLRKRTRYIIEGMP